jgi:hypothetical protein
MCAASRDRLDNLFLAHMTTALLCGAISVVRPQIFLWFLHETLPLNDAGHEVAETITRLYGSLIVAQAMLIKSTRESSDPKARRSFVHAYAVAFGLTSLSLCYSQWIGHFSIYNWVNIIYFAALSVGYSYFVFFEKISTFGLGGEE